MRLRDVVPDDVDAYVRMRCDPAMTSDLGGPLPREGTGREGADGPLRASARSPVRSPVTGRAAR